MVCYFTITLFYTVKNTRFTAWSLNSKSPCGDQTVISQCLSPGDNLDADQMNLVNTACTKEGFQCKNQKDADPAKIEVCPSSMNNRFECPYSPSKPLY